MAAIDNYEQRCPHCDSYNVDYKAMSPEDGIIILPKVCGDCNKSSEEVYQLKYLRTDK